MTRQLPVLFATRYVPLHLVLAGFACVGHSPPDGLASRLEQQERERQEKERQERERQERERQERERLERERQAAAGEQDLKLQLSSPYQAPALVR